MSHPVLHLSWNPGRVASLPLPKPFFLLPQRLSLSLYPFPLLASRPSSLGGHTPPARSRRHPAYSSSRKHRPRSEPGAELSELKPCPHALGGASGPDGAVDWWGRALPRGAGPGGRARAGSAADAAGGVRCGVGPGGVWRRCGGASRLPHAGRGSPKVSMGRGPCAAWARWRDPAGARLRQVSFGRTGPGATSARSRNAGRWPAAAWRERPE